jgi:hypothetical protein
MGRLINRRPSPALFVAVIALVAALAGTAVAEQATTSAKPVTKKKVKKISKKEINKAAPTLSVGSAFALDELEYVRSNRVTVPVGANGRATAVCPDGMAATGGGGAFTGASGLNIQRSYPSDGNDFRAGFTAWEFQVRNQSANTQNIRAYVICANAETTPANYEPGAHPVN